MVIELDSPSSLIFETEEERGLFFVISGVFSVLLMLLVGLCLKTREYKNTVI
jgi:hypothetical protein